MTTEEKLAIIAEILTILGLLLCMIVLVYFSLKSKNLTYALLAVSLISFVISLCFDLDIRMSKK
ncbi:hypothetical protein J5868_01145 [Candidatus Saccharibacteria bacterium]|nr:hypothetical protein [Candidatus Saccharibacteria bacterium]